MNDLLNEHASRLAEIGREYDLAELALFDDHLHEQYSDAGRIGVIFAWRKPSDATLEKLFGLEDSLSEELGSEVQASNRDLLKPEYREVFLKHRRIVYAHLG